MKQRKSNIQKKIAVLLALLLIVFALGTILIRGTWSYYKKSVSGESTATVAKFDAVINNNTKSVAQMTSSDKITLNIFSTIRDMNNNGSESVPNYDEDDVKAGRIAPGTKGEFNVKVQNTGDTAIKAKATIYMDNYDIPLKFSTDGQAWIKYRYVSSPSSSPFQPLEFTLDNIAVGNNKTQTVYWKWDFDAFGPDNEADVAIGTSATTISPKVTVNFDITQID
ncbi:MAG: hypothetical protein LBM02_06055 [Lachnospiraceae bacterium]|nr:hypothetical protein [Lachnospiraceae bacterium]